MDPTSSPDEICYDSQDVDSTYAIGGYSQDRSPSPAYSISQRQREIAQLVSKNQPHTVEPLPNRELQSQLGTISHIQRESQPQKAEYAGRWGRADRAEGVRRGRTGKKVEDRSQSSAIRHNPVSGNLARVGVPRPKIKQEEHDGAGSSTAGTEASKRKYVGVAAITEEGERDERKKIKIFRDIQVKLPKSTRSCKLVIEFSDIDSDAEEGYN